jgi:hypothetical protein
VSFAGSALRREPRLDEPSHPEEAPGRTGCGYGEQVAAGETTIIGQTMVVVVAPSDRPPAEDAPESEKAGLLFAALIVPALFDEDAGER